MHSYSSVEIRPLVSRRKPSPLHPRHLQQIYEESRHPTQNTDQHAACLSDTRLRFMAPLPIPSTWHSELTGPLKPTTVDPAATCCFCVDAGDDRTQDHDAVARAVRQPSVGTLVEPSCGVPSVHPVPLLAPAADTLVGRSSNSSSQPAC